MLFILSQHPNSAAIFDIYMQSLWYCVQQVIMRSYILHFCSNMPTISAEKVYPVKIINKKKSAIYNVLNYSIQQIFMFIWINRIQYNIQLMRLVFKRNTTVRTWSARRQGWEG